MNRRTFLQALAVVCLAAGELCRSGFETLAVKEEIEVWDIWIPTPEQPPQERARSSLDLFVEWSVNTPPPRELFGITN